MLLNSSSHVRCSQTHNLQDSCIPDVDKQNQALAMTQAFNRTTSAYSSVLVGPIVAADVIGPVQVRTSGISGRCRPVGLRRLCVDSYLDESVPTLPPRFMSSRQYQSLDCVVVSVWRAELMTRDERGISASG